jgi:hypothetical protein
MFCYDGQKWNCSNTYSSITIIHSNYFWWHFKSEARLVSLKEILDAMDWNEMKLAGIHCSDSRMGQDKRSNNKWTGEILAGCNNCVRRSFSEKNVDSRGMGQIESPTTDLCQSKAVAQYPIIIESKCGISWGLEPIWQAPEQAKEKLTILPPFALPSPPTLTPEYRSVY